MKIRVVLFEQGNDTPRCWREFEVQHEVKIGDDLALIGLGGLTASMVAESGRNVFADVSPNRLVEIREEGGWEKV